MSRKERIAVYPGSFDPVTWGHLDIVSRASRLFDRVIIAVAKNPLKKPAFTAAERMDMITRSLRGLPLGRPVKVARFDGLLVHYCRKVGARAVIRGLRAVSDFEAEFQMALMNRHLAREVETVYLMPDQRFVYLSSNLVKEVARLGGELDAFVPPFVKSRLLHRKDRG